MPRFYMLTGYKAYRRFDLGTFEFSASLSENSKVIDK